MMKTPRIAITAVAHVLLLAGQALPVSASYWHVKPTGRPDGSGGPADPWTLQAALDGGAVVKGARRVQPGDVVWVHGGTYRGGFRTELRGVEGSPITFRQALGEHAVIDCNPRDSQDTGLFDVSGDWLVVWGLEFTCSDLKRSTKVRGSWPEDIRRGGIFSRGSHNTYINLIVHDTLIGFGTWGTAELGVGGEIYGCLIYNNGWEGPDRAHGHGIYAQNEVGTKRIVDNILFNQFGYGIHCYGSEKASLKGFHIEGNASFNNGSLSGPGKRQPDLFVGGGTAIDRLLILSNSTYGAGGLQLGYASDVRNRGVVVKDNDFAGATRVTALDSGVFAGNTIVAPGTLVNFDRGVGGSTAQLEWDRNTYVRTRVEWAAFNVVQDNRATGLSFNEWQKQTGLDAGSQYRESAAQGVKVIVRPNRYEPGRAHIIVYNWDRRGTVEVDLQKVLKLGQAYRILSAQNIHGDSVASGTYDGKPIVLPMKEGRHSQPVGMPDYHVPTTEPEFGAFVVLTDQLLN